jgi:hypothetical protein
MTKAERKAANRRKKRGLEAAIIALTLALPTIGHAQVCTTFRNQVTCTDGTTVNRYGDVIEVQRPAVRVPGPRSNQLIIQRSLCLQRNGQYGYCDEQSDQDDE